VNKTGFTLVEVLAVILILGLLVTVVYPIVVSTINSSKEKAYNSQIEIIQKAAKIYALDKEGSLPNFLPDLKNDALPKYVPISTLISEGYIAEEELKSKDNDLSEGKLVNPKNGTECTQVKIFYESNQYNYIVVDSSLEECKKIIKIENKK